MIEFWLILIAVALFAFSIGACAGYYSCQKEWMEVLRGIGKTLESQNQTNKDILSLLKPAGSDFKLSEQKTAEQLYQEQQHETNPT